MPITFQVGAVNDKLALARAIAQGYQIALAEDGCAKVTSPEDNVYFIYNFECDCPDKLLRGGLHEGQCKHEIWISQMTPCPICDAVMYLGECHASFGEIIQRFECRTCGHMRDFDTMSHQRHTHNVTNEVA